jgi:hypothetical protein
MVMVDVDNHATSANRDRIRSAGRLLNGRGQDDERINWKTALGDPMRSGLEIGSVITHPTGKRLVCFWLLAGSKALCPMLDGVAGTKGSLVR